MAKVVWTDEAERWLLKIHDHIAKDSPAAAFNVVQSIYDRAQILERFPDLGHGYTSPSGRPRDAVRAGYGSCTGANNYCLG